MRQDFCRHRLFLFERGGARHAVDADRDEGVALEDVHHLETGLVVVENGLVAEAFELRELAAVGGKHGEHGRGEAGWADEEIEDEGLVAFSGVVTPFRIVEAVLGFLVLAPCIFDRHAEDLFRVGFGDDCGDIDFFIGQRGTRAETNDCG